MQTSSLEFIPLPYLELDSSLCLTFINKIAKDVFGEEAVLGQTPNFFLAKLPEVNNNTSSSNLSFSVDDSKEQRLQLKETLKQLADTTKSVNEDLWGGVAVLEYWIKRNGKRRISRSEVIVRYQPIVSELDIPTPPSSSITTPHDSAATYNFNLQDSPCSFTILFVKPLKPFSIDLPPKSHLPMIDVRYFLPDGATPPAEVGDPMLKVEKPVAKDELMPSLAEFSELMLMAPVLEEASHYKDMIDYLPQIAFTADSAGRITYFNNQWFTYTGLTQEESTDVEKLAEVFWPDDMKLAINLWFDAVRMSKDFEAEYRVRGADLIWRWCVAKGRPIRKVGAPTFWIVTITPVDQLIQARSEALRIQGLIAAVLNGAGVTLLSVNKESIVTFCEGSALTASGLGTPMNDKDPVGQVLGSIWPDPEVAEAVRRMLDEELDVLTWQTTAEKAINDQYFQYRLVPLKEVGIHSKNEVTGVIIVAGDITHIVEAKVRLAQSEQERVLLIASETAAKEASRLKTEFVTNISHEIRTPIAAMIGICEILLDDTSLKESQRGLVEKSLRSGENLLDLVGMVLDMGKLVEAGKLQIEKYPFLLADVLDDAALFSVPAIHKGLKFISDIGNHYTGILQGDRVRIRQVLANVLSNSIKFTKEGSITLTLRQESENTTQCTFVFSIRDTGIGIQEHILPTLFVPFQQADTSTAREYGGSGLGLTISKNLVELMGGTLVLESTAAVGTTMTIRIPLEKSALSCLPADRTPNDSPTPPLLNEDYGSWEGTKILVAEDNELILDIVTRILRKKKFDVTGVCDGLAAVKAVEEGDFDLLLLDGQMPRMDDYEAAASIRQLSDPKKRNIKIIALTASAFKGNKERCLNAGMNGYLSKPVRAKDLEATIWEQLRPSEASGSTVRKVSDI